MSRRDPFLISAGLAALAIGTLATFLLWSVPGERSVVAVDDLALLGASLLATVSLAAASTRAQGGTKIGWRVASLGAGLYLLGMVEWTRRQVFLGVAVPSPSVADAFFLGYMVVGAIGLTMLRSRSPAGKLRLLLDGVAVALSVLILSLVVVVLPIIESASGAIDLSVLIFVAYPMGDVLMITIAATLAMRAPRRDQPTFYLLAGGAASVALADSSYAYLAIQGRYATGALSDVLWFAGFLLFALAGLKAREQPLAATAAPAARASTLVPSAAMGAVMVALIVLSVNDSTGMRLHTPAVMSGLIGLLAVLIARHAVSVHDHANLVRDLEATVNTVQQQVAERTAALERSNADLKHFASAASHDLQEPLRTVRSYTQLIERRYAAKLDDDGREFLRYASDAAERMTRLIEGLLVYTRIDLAPRETRAVPSERALEEAQANLATAIRETGATVSVETPLPVVAADPAQLSIVFQNLVGNAIKYRGPETPIVRISASRERDAWRFVVRDNGIGIDPQYHDRVFGIFQRLHTQEDRPGSGIGLAVCRRVVERFGGRIWVESAPGQGAAFHFTLPDAGATA